MCQFSGAAMSTVGQVDVLARRPPARPSARRAATRRHSRCRASGRRCPAPAARSSTAASPCASGIFSVPPSAWRVPGFSVTSSIRGASACQPPSGAGAVRQDHRAGVPGLALGVGVDVEEDAPVGEVQRRPLPEEARRCRAPGVGCGSGAPTGRMPQERSRVPVQPAASSRRSPSTSVQPETRTFWVRRV